LSDSADKRERAAASAPVLRGVNSGSYYLADFVTKEHVRPNNFVFTGDNNPWEVVVDLETIRRKINLDYFRKSPPYVSKYLPFMPISDYSNFVSLGEGATPLIKSKRLGEKFGLDVYFKLETQNPTGSFKDRGSAVELSIAKELGVKGIILASTGNMAASCSCYAASAGLPCFVFVPEETPPSKLSQVISYGGHVVQVKGSYGEAAQLAKHVAEDLGFYLAGDYAFRVEGAKTAAFELIDQLFFQVPDIVVVPMGCGTNITSYAKGFLEYKKLGFIPRIPQLVGVNAAGAPSIVNAFRQGAHTYEPAAKVESIATAIAINDPLDGRKALDAIYQSNGEAVAVTDKEMLQAQYLLSREEGLFVEASSAASLAAIIKLSGTRALKGKSIVCILTGAGLKDPSPILRIALKPPVIYPDPREFKALYDKMFFEGSSITFVEREEVIFTSDPDTPSLDRALTKLFGTTYPPQAVAKIKELIGRFLLKGKAITFADFQDIVQDAIGMLSSKGELSFTVTDFEVTTGRDRKAKASVRVKVSGQEKSGSAEGVGPVDAVINALRNACGGIEFSLPAFKVTMRSQGTDAAVVVELKLRNAERISVGKGSSPDIIQASIEAFEDAYNSLLHSSDTSPAGPASVAPAA
jgi:threonine synthase